MIANLLIDRICPPCPSCLTRNGGRSIASVKRLWALRLGEGRGNLITSHLFHHTSYCYLLQVSTYLSPARYPPSYPSGVDVLPPVYDVVEDAKSRSSLIDDRPCLKLGRDHSARERPLITIATTSGQEGSSGTGKNVGLLAKGILIANKYIRHSSQFEKFEGED